MPRLVSFAVALLVPTMAAAQPIKGLYIGGDVGANFVGSLDTTQDRLRFNTNPGPIGIVAMGWGFGNGLRAEIEGSVRSNGIGSLDTLRVNGLLEPVQNPVGDVRTYAVMVNAAYDLPFRPLGLPITPYVGAGAGYAWLGLGNAGGNEFVQYALPRSSSGSTGGASGFRPPPEYNTSVDYSTLGFGSGGAFAYQAIGGVSAPLRILPGLSATLEYRYFGTTQINLTQHYVAIDGNTVNGVTPSASTTRHFTLSENAVLIGLRYAFGAVPRPVSAAPPVAPPPAAPSRSYLVFFDWDKAMLTDRARQIVAEAAAGSTRVQYTRIDVNGYTDTSGLARYNQGLSVRRAKAVAAELVKDGVPATAIAIKGFGETHLLVPTGQGVREPQNRRVEIIMH